MVPSVDLMGGDAVQLIGGREPSINAGDPSRVARWLGLAGTLAVIDLDAAMGQGDNASVVETLVAEHRVRVGGGIRTERAARRWLDLGAEAVILGTAAEPSLLRRLPRDRVIAAVDAVHGDVVVDGWRTRTGGRLIETVRRLAPYVGGFLVTFVEREGRLSGTAMERVPALVEAAGDARLTVAGGICAASEIAELDRMGVDAQVGMALYTGQLSLADGIAAPLTSDRADGLWPTVVCDAQGVALGLAYSNPESLRRAIEQRRGVYWSRRRGLWEKGASSGASQTLLGVDVDCDRDTLRFRVEQSGSGFCHTGSWSCFDGSGGLPALMRRLESRQREPVDDSYTRRLLDDPRLLRAKLLEEADELASAVTPSDVAHETADLIYFALVAAVRAGVPLSSVEGILDRRSLRTRRRSGDAKRAILESLGGVR